MVHAAYPVEGQAQILSTEQNGQLREQLCASRVVEVVARHHQWPACLHALHGEKDVCQWALDHLDRLAQGDGVAVIGVCAQ